MSAIKWLMFWIFVAAAAASHPYYTYFDWSDLTKTGDDLRQSLIEENDFIVVTYWFRHIRHDEDQNKRNLVLKGSIKNLISRCHPSVKYTEADISDYNVNAYTYQDVANEWNIDLTILDDGPLTMIIHQQHGSRFWGHKDTPVMTIMNKVDDYIRYQEKIIYGRESFPWPVELDYTEVQEFKVMNPWNNYEEFVPHQRSSTKFIEEDYPTPSPAPVPSKPRKEVELNEPSKAVLY